MTTQIMAVKNSSAGAIVLADNSSGGCIGIPPNTWKYILWTVSTSVYQLCILGPGATNIGPGTYDWIYDDSNWNIDALRAGPYQPRQLVHVSGGGILYVALEYLNDGSLVARQVLGPALPEHFHEAALAAN